MVHYPSIDAYGLKLSVVGADLINNRNELRKLVIKQLWEEKPGEGKGEKTAHYTYYVEKLADNRRVFITRPAIKRQGFDFIIHVENYNFGNDRDNPKHEDIIEDLRQKSNLDPAKFDTLKKMLDKVFYCHDPDDLLSENSILSFNSGFGEDLILKVCKWFFIEQDIRYWNYSGRGMLKEGIDNI